MDKYRKGFAADQELKKLGDQLSVAFSTWVSDAQPSALWRTCASCTFAQREGSAYCHKYKMTPPIKVIVGDQLCEGYSDDQEIPF